MRRLYCWLCAISQTFSFGNINEFAMRFDYFLLCFWHFCYFDSLLPLTPFDGPSIKAFSFWNHVINYFWSQFKAKIFLLSAILVIDEAKVGHWQPFIKIIFFWGDKAHPTAHQLLIWFNFFFSRVTNVVFGLKQLRYHKLHFYKNFGCYSLLPTIF